MPDETQLYDEADQLKVEGKFEEAIAKLHEALAVKEDYALAHAALAVIHQKLGRHDEAVQHAQRAADLEPDDPFSYTALSVTYQRAFAGTGKMEYIHLAEQAMERSRMLGHK